MSNRVTTQVQFVIIGGGRSPCFSFEWRVAVNLEAVNLEKVEVVTDSNYDAFILLGMGSITNDPVLYSVSLVKCAGHNLDGRRSGYDFGLNTPTTLIKREGQAGKNGWEFEFAPKLVGPKGALLAGFHPLAELDRHAVFVTPTKNDAASATVVYLYPVASVPPELPPHTDLYRVIDDLHSDLGPFAVFIGKEE